MCLETPDWVASYIGIAFREHGRDRQGCDCWGLHRLVLGEQLGFWLPSYATTYEAAHDGAGVAATIEANGTGSPEWRAVPAGAERPFDAVHMIGFRRGDDGRLRRHAMHVGTVIGGGWLLHVEAGINACLADYRRRGVRNRVIGFYRHHDQPDV